MPDQMNPLKSYKWLIKKCSCQLNFVPIVADHLPGEKSGKIVGMRSSIVVQNVEQSKYDKSRMVS